VRDFCGIDLIDVFVSDDVGYGFGFGYVVFFMGMRG